MTASSDPFRLDGKRILVTGASSGLGREIAFVTSRAGAEVILTGRDAVRLAETLGAMANPALHKVVAADLTSDEDLTRIADEAGAVDGIVHAAGLAGPAPIRVVNRSFILERFDANYFAPVLLTQRILAKNRLRADGSIVFLSSIAAHTGTRGMSIYSATKASLVATARCLALELAKHRIRVNCVSPGLVRTPIFKPEHQAWLESEDKRYPLGLGTPADVAYAALFLLSSASRWMTGQAIILDGACDFV